MTDTHAFSHTHTYTHASFCRDVSELVSHHPPVLAYLADCTEPGWELQVRGKEDDAVDTFIRASC